MRRTVDVKRGSVELDVEWWLETVDSRKLVRCIEILVPAEFDIPHEGLRLSWDEPEPGPHWCEGLYGAGGRILQRNGRWSLYDDGDLIFWEITGCPFCNWKVPE